MLGKWFSALTRTRSVFQNLAGVITGNRPPDPAVCEELEVALVRADVPPRLAAEIIGELKRADIAGAPASRVEAVILRTLLTPQPVAWEAPPHPRVVLLVGVNGSGKTTTAAKLAWQVRQAGRAPMLAATDTFRAAGADQLRVWADRVGCEVIAGAHGADAAAVAYDAISAAIAREADVLFIDTAGRMHTKKHLMNELQKVRRSIAKACPGAPHETWIVLDATLGNNAIVQAREFKECVEVTGAIVTKLDGSSKGGFVLGLAHDLRMPIRYIGLGEELDSLAAFDAREFVRGLLGGGG